MAKIITPKKVSYKCDICSDEYGIKHFKVKKPKYISSLKRWKRLDICDSCYRKFVSLCFNKED